MKKGIAFAILAAALYAVNAPFSKILLDCIPPTLMAGFLYVGAGIGMIIIALVRKIRKNRNKRIKTDKIGIAVHCGNDTFGHSRTDLLDVRIERDNRRQCVTAQQF